MNVESDESVLDEVMSQEEESEGEDLAETEALKARSEPMEEEEEAGLRVEDIDSFWLQRRIGEYEKDAEKAQALAEKVLEALRNSDERESEAQLVELVGLDHPDLISLLLSNRAKIAYVIRWRQAESEAARHAIAEELLADASLDGASVLKALEANRSTKEWGLSRNELAGTERVERHTPKEQGAKLDAEALREEEMLGVAAELNVPKPKAQLSLSDLAFAAGSHVMSNKYSDPEYLNSHRLVAVEDMPEWFHKGFDGVKKLNLVQSQVYECAMLSSVGLWWECDCRRTCCCAPRRELERRTWR